MNQLDNKHKASTKYTYLMGLATGVALMIIALIAFPAMTGPPVAAGVTEPAQFGSLSFNDIAMKLDHIYQIIDNNFIGDFDIDEAIDMMFAGFVFSANDPYTVYMSQESFRSFREDTDGEFIGIGVHIIPDNSDNRIMVIAPIEGSPAFEAGILPGDKIISVDGYDVFADDVNRAIRMMRGEVGTTVNVTIFRESDNTTLNKTLTRDRIQLETVRHSLLDDNIGYIRISNFDRVTYDQFVTAYEGLMAQNIEGLILDLRNNPGGLLDVVNNITDMLVPEGIITFTEDVHGNRVYARSDDRQIEIPLLVLVNGNSASASEVLSGAVSDRGVGELVGTTTFGKGLVQSVFVLHDQSAVKVTVARYFTPNGTSIHGEGITPQHYIEMEQELTNNLLLLSPEEDIQLQHAIELMLQRISN